MPDALTTAFDRLDDFVAVQHACGGPTLGVPAEMLLLGIIVARLAG